MKIKDIISYNFKSLKKSTRDKIYILISSLLLTSLFISIVAFVSYNSFISNNVNNNLQAQRITICVDEIPNTLKNNEFIEEIDKEYLFQNTAKLNDTSTYFYYLPNNELKGNEIYLSNTFIAIIEEKEYNANDLIGKELEIKVENDVVTKVKVLGTFDSSKYYLDSDSAITSKEVLNQIADKQKETMDENVSLENIFTLVVKEIKYKDEVISILEENNIEYSNNLELDYEYISKVNKTILLIFIVLLIGYIFIKEKLIATIMRKENKNIGIFMINNYDSKNITKIYLNKFLLISTFIITISTLLMFIIINYYNSNFTEMINYGLKINIPLYVVVLCILLEYLYSMTICKLKLNKINKKDIIEIINEN